VISFDVKLAIHLVISFENLFLEEVKEVWMNEILSKNSFYPFKFIVKNLFSN
jgi:hypothetical protein